MANAVSSARDSVAPRAAAKACSTSAAKRPTALALEREGLHGAHAADRLGGEGGGVGEPVLRDARALPHAAAEGDDRAARSPG